MTEARSLGGTPRPATSFSLVNPVLEDWLDQQSLELSGQVSETTLMFVRATLQDGILLGEGMDQLTARVAEVFEDASARRARLIARTEANKAANGASWYQARTSGVVTHKTWVATGDSRTRQEHRVLNGMTLPIDVRFPNGLQFPSEPNCRCTLVYVVDEAQAGPLPAELLAPPPPPSALQSILDEDEEYATDPEDLLTGEALEQARMEEKLMRDMVKRERSELFQIIQEAGGIRTNDALREEYRNIANVFKRRDGLPGDEMADYLATYFPQYGIRDERDLLDFFVEW